MFRMGGKDRIPGAWSAWPDRDRPRLGGAALGEADGQDAVAGVGLGGIGVDIGGDHDLAKEGAEAAAAGKGKS